MYLPAEMMEIGEVSVAAKDKASFEKPRESGGGRKLGEMILCV